MSIEEKIKRHISAELDVALDEVVPGAKFIDDLGADSLDIVQLLMALEDEFGLEITDEEAEKLVTVQAAIDFIKERVSI